MDKYYSNPFIGLRPFNTEEDVSFFGRENILNKIISNIQSKRFSSIIGYRYSGKTSLINAGVVPRLKQLETHFKEKWHVIRLEPDEDPIGNLASSISEFMESRKQSSTYSKLEIEKKLRFNSNGLIEVLDSLQFKANEQLVIIVDQFEALFKQNSSPSEKETVIQEDARHFLKLLISSIKQKETPLHLLIALDSDYLTNCSLVPGLTSIVNQGQVFVPEMEIKELKTVVLKTFEKSNYEIDPELTNILLSDLKGNSYPLNRLQHALRRCVEYHEKQAYTTDVKINLESYNNIGTIKDSLKIQLEEIYTELNDLEKQVCENLFKRIVRLRVNDTHFSTPSVSEITSICEQNSELVKSVISKFFTDDIRALKVENRSNILNKLSNFNSKKADKTELGINSDSKVELTTYLILTVWDRLKEWVKEEEESVLLYHKIHHSAILFDKKIGGLYKNPDLSTATKWIKKQKPNKAWAQRYQLNFDKAITFINKSKLEYEKTKKLRTKKQEDKIRTARRITIAVCIASLVPVLLAIYAISERKKAKRSEKIALETMREAEDSKERAIIAEETALNEKTKAEKDKLIAQKALVQEQDAKQKADLAKKITESALKQATINAKKARSEKQKAVLSEIEALKSKAIADTLKYRNQARLLAMRVLQNENKNYTKNRESILKANKLNKIYNNDKVFTELYMGLRKTISESGKLKLDYLESFHALTSVNIYENLLIVGTSFGTIKLYELFDNGQANLINELFIKKDREIRSVSFNPSTQHIVCGTDKGEIFILNPSETKHTIKNKIVLDKGEVIKDIIHVNNGYHSYCLVLSYDFIYIYHSDKKYLLKEKLKVNRSSRIIKLEESNNSFLFSNANVLQVANLNNEAKLNGDFISFENNISASNTNENNSIFVIGDELGNVISYNIKSKTKTQIHKHNSEVTGVVFTELDGMVKISSSSYDNEIISSMINENNKVTNTYNIHSNQGWILDLKSSANKKTLYSIGKKNNLKIWFSDTREMIKFLKQNNP